MFKWCLQSAFGRLRKFVKAQCTAHVALMASAGFVKRTRVAVEVQPSSRRPHATAIFLEKRISGDALATKLLLSIARKLTGSEEVDFVCGGPALTEDEVAQITRAELDKFSEELIERRLRQATGQPTEQAGSSVKTGCVRLPDEIIAQTDSQRAQMKRILGHARSSILGESSLEALRKALAETSIEEQMRKFGIGDAFKDQMRAAGVGDAFKDHMLKLGIGESANARMRKDLLGASALDAPIKTFKASDNLSESIACCSTCDGRSSSSSSSSSAA
jgi:hypothetical protein